MISLQARLFIYGNSSARDIHSSLLNSVFERKEIPKMVVVSIEIEVVDVTVLVITKKIEEL